MTAFSRISKRRQAKRRMSAHSSSLLLGLALAVILSQSALLCHTGALSAFGWAILANLAGCFYSTLSHWNELIQTFVPESKTWKRALFAGLFLAIGLLSLGQSLASDSWSPINSIALAVVPWSRSLWRRFFVGDAVNQPRERVGAFVVFCAIGLFLFPEFNALIVRLSEQTTHTKIGALLAAQIPPLPRTWAVLSALAFGAASSLQNPQQRTISSQTYWTIPTAVSAIILSAAGWIALHLEGSRDTVVGQFQNLPIHRLFALSPAILFGVVMLALRPQMHIRNSLRIGKESTHWWQTLGLFAGISISFLLVQNVALTHFDLATIIALLLGQYVGLRTRPSAIQFAPALASVPLLEAREPLSSSQQN